MLTMGAEKQQQKQCPMQATELHALVEGMKQVLVLF